MSTELMTCDKCDAKFPAHPDAVTECTVDANCDCGECVSLEHVPEEKFDEIARDLKLGPEEVATLRRDGSVDYCILLCAPCRRELFPDVTWEDEKEGGRL